MRIVPGKQYIKSYRKLPPKSRDAVDKALRVFVADPFAPSLRNHPLKGEWAGVRSIDAGFDMRILYTDESDHTVVLLVDVGTHSQLYG